MESIKRVLKRKNIVIVPKSLRHGFVQIPTPIMRCSNLSRGAKTAYVLLLSYAWQDDFCFPGQERMAKDCGVHLNTIREDLAELKEKKLIDWKQRGLTKTNVYYILDMPNEIVDNYEKRKAKDRFDLQQGVSQELQQGVNY